MNALKAVVHNRRIELAAPEELPDGTEVLVEVTRLPALKVGIDESEWRDDPAALADWENWLKTLEPLELTAEESETFNRFEAEFARFNLEEVRKQMAEGIEP